MKNKIHILLICLAGFPIINLAQTTYHYDKLNRLDTVQYSNGEFIAYKYDELSNRTQKSFGIKMPKNNITIDAFKESCDGSGDGKMVIHVKDYRGYTIKIGTIIDTFFRWENHLNDTGLTLDNLSFGNYYVCFTRHPYPRTIYEECISVFIPFESKLPKPWLKLTKPNGEYQVQIKDGKPPYTIRKNGLFYLKTDDKGDTFKVKFNDYIQVSDKCGNNTDIVVSDFTLGVSQIDSLSSITIHPNPSKEFLYINLQNFTQSKLTVEVYSTIGKLQFIQELNSSNKKFKLNIENLPVGVYYLKVPEYSNSGYKFIKK